MLYLTREQLEELIDHAKKESPNEACGIFAGKSYTAEGQTKREVNKVYRMNNVEKSASTFFMDAKEQLMAMKEIRKLGLNFIGIYHSHPETEPYPSAHDVEMSFYPEASYVIISLKDKDNPKVRSFRIREGKIEEEGVSYN